MTTTATPVADAIKERLAPALDTIEAFERKARRARRAAARGRYAAEDAMTGAALGVRRRPFRSLALAAGAGALAGCMVAYALGRRCAADARDAGEAGDGDYKSWLE